MNATALAPFRQPGVVFEEDIHRYTYHRQPVLNVTTIMREHKISADWSIVPADLLLKKREIGRAAHIATHYFDDGTLQIGTVADEVTPYLDAWRRFVEEQEFVPLLLENVLVHPGLLYGGMVDRFGIVRRLSRGDLPSVVDIKTGDPKDAGAHVQTAAYEQLIRSLWPEIYAHLQASGAELPWPLEISQEAWTRYSVQLFPNGRYHLTPYTNFRDFQRFSWALSLEADAHRSWRRAS